MRRSCGSGGDYLFKLSTVSRFLKGIRAVALLVFVVHFSGVFTEDSAIRDVVKRVLPGIYAQFSKNSPQQVSARELASEGLAKGASATESIEDLCLPMGERERRKIANEAGADVVGFLEKTTDEFHSAPSAEEQLKLLGSHFDHMTWSRALVKSAKSKIAETRVAGADTEDPLKNATTKEGDVALQANLTHATLFLSHYNRLVDLARRHEVSALRAFHWEEEIRQEMSRRPARVLVQKYDVANCGRSEAKTYGCEVGEKLFLVKTLLSPRLACRFREKRDQYQVTYWIRVRAGEAKILEVDSRRERLVKKTYDEQSNRQFAAILAPDLNALLPKAGLEPFRAVMIWREVNRSSKSGESSKNETSTETSTGTPTEAPSGREPASVSPNVQ